MQKAEGLRSLGALLLSDFHHLSLEAAGLYL